MKQDYITINGLRMYYEVHGNGQPLILIHGGLSSIQTSFAKILPELAKSYKVYAVELQGHAHTEDIEREFSYDFFADDISQFIKQLNISNPSIFGYSVGAGVALRVAMKYPGSINKLILASVTYNDEGIYPTVKEMSSQVTPEMMEGSVFQLDYAKTAPKPENWAALVKKMGAFEKKPQDWPETEIQAITAPIFLINGDADIIKPEHTIALFRLLKGGVPGDIEQMSNSRLAILPATTHIGLLEREEIVPMIDDFLKKNVKVK